MRAKYAAEADRIERCLAQIATRNTQAAISNRTYVWDYIVNFGAYVQPFPNYYVLAPNIRYYLDHGVRGMYEEGNGEQQPSFDSRSS